MPDFCTGFLYVTRPSVGAALAQAGLEMFRDSEDIVITEDYLIAGVLRQRLGEVGVESLRQELTEKQSLLSEAGEAIEQLESKIKLQEDLYKKVKECNFSGQKAKGRI